MTIYLDDAGKRSAKRQKQNAAENRARLDAEIRVCAKKSGHHGAAEFVEYIRQRCNVAITLDYAKELCGEK
jgi:hypothetical protein